MTSGGGEHDAYCLAEAERCGRYDQYMPALGDLVLRGGGIWWSRTSSLV